LANAIVLPFSGLVPVELAGVDDDALELVAAALLLALVLLLLLLLLLPHAATAKLATITRAAALSRTIPVPSSFDCG
jgi:hypothetical protein